MEDQLKLYDKRHRLQTRIDTFILEGKAYLPSSDEEEEGGNFQLSSMVWEDDEEADEGEDSIEVQSETEVVQVKAGHPNKRLRSSARGQNQ